MAENKPTPPEAITPKIGPPNFSRREFLKRGGALFAAAAVPPIFLPSLINGPTTGDRPPTAVPTTPTGTPTSTATPTETPGPTEIPVIKELVLAQGSALVANPFRPDTAWTTVGEGFNSGRPVQVVGTYTDSAGTEYHQVQDETQNTWWIYNSQNSIDPDKRILINPDLEYSVSVVSPKSPFIVRSGSGERFASVYGARTKIETSQGFKYQFEGTIEGNSLQLVTANITNIQQPGYYLITTVTAEGRASAQLFNNNNQPVGQPITADVGQGVHGNFALTLTVERSGNSDLVYLDKTPVDPDQHQKPASGSALPVPGGFKNKLWDLMTVAKQASATVNNATVIASPLEHGVLPEELHYEEKVDGGLQGKIDPAKKIDLIGAGSEIYGLHNGLGYADIDLMNDPTSGFATNSEFALGKGEFLGVEASTVKASTTDIDYINDPASAFSANGEFLGVDVSPYILSYIASQGLTTDVPLNILKQRTDSLSPAQVRQYIDAVRDSLAPHPGFGVAFKFINKEGKLDVDPKLFSLYPNPDGSKPKTDVEFVANLARTFSNRTITLTPEFDFDPVKVRTLLTTVDSLKAKGIPINTVSTDTYNFSGDQRRSLHSGLALRNIQPLYRSVVSSNAQDVISLCEEFNGSRALVIAGPIIHHGEWGLEYDDADANGPKEATPFGSFYTMVIGPYVNQKPLFKEPSKPL